jgi:hypothetical protein
MGDEIGFEEDFIPREYPIPQIRCFKFRTEL